MPHSSNPYVGPRTFLEADRHLFFGREREARDLLSFVIAEPLTLFYAQSGAGKSSIINTRLVPSLRHEGFAVLPVGRVGGTLPEGIETVDNIFTFNLLLRVAKNQTEPNKLVSISLSDYLQSIKPKTGDSAYEEKEWILIIDQFEEIVTTNLERWEEREPFFNQLRQAMVDDPFLWIVLVLREDHIAALEPYRYLLPSRMKNRFYMRRMGVEAALEAVQKPALQRKRPFAPGVAASLVDNLRQIRVQDQSQSHLGEYVEPVQLQVVCQQLWENLQASEKQEITAQDLAQLGDVDVALARFYENTLTLTATKTGESEAKLRRWFEHQLITETGMRGIVYRGTETTGDLANEAVEILANRYLLRSERRAGSIWYELIHDRFVEPILKANQNWRLQQDWVYQAAETWDRSGRSRDKLFYGEQLQEALATLTDTNLDPLLQTFLTASQDVQSQRDLASVQLARRRLGWIVAGLVVLLLIALALAGFANRQSNISAAAEAEARRAESTLAVEIIVRREAEADAREAQAKSLENEQLAAARLAEFLVAQETANASSTEIAKVTGTAVSALETQAAELEQQLLAVPTTTPTGELTTMTVTSQLLTPDLKATSTAIAIQTQLAQIHATQTAIATPTTKSQETLIANFPAVSVNIRSRPTTEADLVQAVRGPRQLPVLQAPGDWVQVALPNGQTGWASGHFLTYEGNIDLLPRGLKYRMITGRDDIPFSLGKVSSFGGAAGDYLLRDPNDELSGIVWIPVDTDVIVLLEINGTRSYGSGLWYLVDVVESGRLLTGYLPSEIIVRR